jgi:hypothetical protein
LIKKGIFLVIIICFLTSGIALTPAEAAPYQGYNYSYWGESVPSPVAYTPYQIIDGEYIGVGSLKSPNDMYVASDNKIYILDTGNNRIVVTDYKWKLLQVITSFPHDGTEDRFNNPQGIYVTESGSIYVADTENKRIVELNQDGDFKRIIGSPESDVLRQGFEYFPVKVAVDKANRIYVVGRGVFDGLVEFDADGKFSKFTGANRVKFNPADYFWKMLSTKVQRDRLEQFIPIEFSNLDLDGEGFIYTTTSELNSDTPIQRLNPSGVDILRREGYYSPQGDLEYTFTGDNSGSSIFNDINVNDYGIYSALDIKRGRIFTYSDDGDLLYVFGKKGKQLGSFKVPVSIDKIGDHMVVLDQGLNNITTFEPTLFGLNVNEAAKLYYEGKEELSAEAWQEVIRLNANYDVAYIGIGKALLRQERNDEAMEYFKLGMSRQYHSKAYERHRKDVFREHLGTVMSGLLVLVLIFVVYRIVRRVRKARLTYDVH